MTSPYIIFKGLPNFPMKLHNPDINHLHFLQHYPSCSHNSYPTFKI